MKTEENYWILLRHLCGTFTYSVNFTPQLGNSLGEGSLPPWWRLLVSEVIFKDLWLCMLIFRWLPKILAQLCTFVSPGLRLCRHHWLKAQGKGENLRPIIDRNRSLGRRKLGRGMPRVIQILKAPVREFWGYLHTQVWMHAQKMPMFLPVADLQVPPMKEVKAKTEM